MCSINGFSWRDETLIKKMNAVTTHRGPDGSGTFVGSSVTLGHNRLSIIDLSDAGNQPMKSDDGRYVISFNGEIYNFRELKKELSSYPFKSQSDTEVILAAFSAWGESAFSRLNGMFAFALWDEKEKMLRLVRDPVGIKPLYYHIDGTRLIFASEIKAILKDAKVSRRINPLALDCYLRLNYVPAPLTMFRDIKKLLPGKILRHQNGKVELVHYATQKIPALSLESRNVLAAELLEKVHKSVEAQLVSDRPVGLYLSGGIDSSAILESMAHARGVVETFSVGFELREGEQAEKFNADFLLARRTAKYFGAKHHEVLLSPKEIIPLFEEAVYHLDEPISNATIIPMLRLARFAKTRVAVVLCGDGGDELFGGYERYRLSLLSSYYRSLPTAMRGSLDTLFPRLQKLNTAPGIERYARFHFLKEDILEPLCALSACHAAAARDFFSQRFFYRNADSRGYEDTRIDADTREPFETKFMRVDRESWLPDEALLRSDKMSMASSLETRVPLLNLPLIDFADTIPRSDKVSLFRTKIVLKKAFRGRIPDELLHQPKRGWFSPGAKWLRYPHVASFAREVLSPHYAEATKGIFDWTAVRSLFDAHLRGEYHLTPLWAILTLQLWAKKFSIAA
ncbi:MAG: asparagine synthase (glutamine-hydrolyzing) [Candidatus Taylorbacteria bacterium RIFCSPHIGHO2_02_49_25]|uniref:asparagine synthase (glutamine-hydrolyzing) n=1 Tax=Candidatus Taylorbacteria bacterium RIFCSPHIGHO2_02_49_25 TaxID=1802305 RepID=A0A1G2MD96_9BACT|nr:MAG: Asparagine synthetase [Parcubacteria group bacterium GW2011_GWF2_50_9]OHA19156.1 MAG: asparagine synthase (glutamine-hydrolyzing) [Candidatus Taylorbacteria bacterium RIFCSPHIGHO2_01_FULL_49_60]OHA21099.1 MAG: asparagine synthase (glutamine-hydrolyzing) [Candidatus Taylorbacteria bacterium RIFCSPHIGHO2_02_49_25]OHA35931.1 MAG: asparagine synthase (glutamine-hydrolyzing) [Candidatus Taylorbacteria bacterium RIFCSPLOWO2_01_FULL_50_130]OHA37314.1 MAG: asparagine synthase (glutamine-hydroly